MAFTVGMKVVCVDDEVVYGAIDVVNGKIYTVAATGLIHPADRQRLPCVCLVGVDGIYWQRRFRPLVSRKTNIDVFKAMLKPTEVNA